MKQSLLTKSIMDRNEFTVTWELVPGRGAKEKNIEAIFTRAEAVAKSDIIQAITITDNAGGNPAMSSEYMGVKLQQMGIEPLAHFTCKDKNRNQIESLLYALEREEIFNILVLTGDYPVSGFSGRSKPVFDLDSVQTLHLISELNQGLEFKNLGSDVKLNKTHFFSGAAVSPFKKLESELTIQYYKLLKKIKAGARFIVTQLGYDARKFHEVIQFMKINNLKIPVMGNIYVLTYPAARAMNANRVPGCVVTDKLVEELAAEKEAEDKGRKAGLLRAAKMYSFLKGMGYAGAHIGGHGLNYEDVEFIIEKGEELTPVWQEFIPEFDFPQDDGFYFFKKDEKTGLNTNIPADRTYRGKNDISNRIFRGVHSTFFEPESPFFKPVQYFFKLLDDSVLEEPFDFFERLIKTTMNDCRQCGDCALLDLAYLCPMSQCPKDQRNGACGGSKDGWCEVYPGERKCIYVRAYDRLKPYHEEDQLKEYIPPVNWDLHNTSSWLNYFLGRDHSANTNGLGSPESKNNK